MLLHKWWVEGEIKDLLLLLLFSFCLENLSFYITIFSLLKKGLIFVEKEKKKRKKKKKKKKGFPFSLRNGDRVVSSIVNV